MNKNITYIIALLLFSQVLLSQTGKFIDVVDSSKIPTCTYYSYQRPIEISPKVTTYTLYWSSKKTRKISKILQRDSTLRTKTKIDSLLLKHKISSLKKQEGDSVNGNREGVWNYWDRKGKLIKTEEYKNDKLISTK